MVDLFNSVTANTSIQIVMLFLVIFFLRDTVVIYNEYTHLCGHKWFILHCFIKKMTFSYVNIFYGAINYVHILFSFCFLFRRKILIHGSHIWRWAINRQSFRNGSRIKGWEAQRKKQNEANNYIHSNYT